LSTWIRDYLYIPLGGGNGSQARQLVILLLVMGIAGLWHGANTSFIVWGVLWGAYIGMHRIATAHIGRVPALERLVNNTFARVLLWAIHLLVIVCLWVFFRAENSTIALEYLAVMFSMPDRFSDQAALVLFGCVALMGLHYLEARGLRLASRFSARSWNRPLVWGFLTGICLWLVLLPSYTENPFIYFRF
jgi:alginate O-acetyltransferase complex protein AlgI